MFLGNWYKNPGIQLRSIRKLNYIAIHKFPAFVTDFFSAILDSFAPSAFAEAPAGKIEDGFIP
jgi:hypothetical protein